MEPVLLAAVVLLTVLTVVNLVVLFALVRRVRGAEAAGVWRPGARDMPVIGTRVGPLAAATLDGDLVTDRHLSTGDTFVGFVQPGCGPCGVFADRVERGDIRLPAGAVLFVAGDDRVEAGAYALRVAAHARICVVDTEGPELSAFGTVNAFPTFLRVSGGVVVAADYRAEEILDDAAQAAR